MLRHGLNREHNLYEDIGEICWRKSSRLIVIVALRVHLNFEHLPRRDRGYT